MKFKIVNSVNGVISDIDKDQLAFDFTTRKFVLGTLGSKNYTIVELEDARYFENKSWTRSFCFDKEVMGWTGLHSYIPNFYLYTHNSLYSFIASSNKIWKHNIEGLYNSFYGIPRAHILEYVTIGDRLTTQIVEDITLHTKALKLDLESREYLEQNITFNKLVAYNSRQSTGELELNNKDEYLDSAYLMGQILNKEGEITISRVEKDWNLNEIRDNVIDPSSPLFLKNWDSIKSQYPIDKVVNNSNINFSKDWTELESLRDKYLIVRLKFDNFTDVQLTTNYLVNTKGTSFR